MSAIDILFFTSIFLLLLCTLDALLGWYDRRGRDTRRHELEARLKRLSTKPFDEDARR